MTGHVVLVPTFLLPEEADTCVGYASGVLPETDTLEQVGFFVPDYIENPNLEWMASMPNLDTVQLPTVGFDAALEALPSGVTLCNAAGVHEQSTAELTVGLIIARWRGIDRAARDMEKRRWDHRRGRSLQDAQVTILGAGGVGRRIADALQPLGCHVTLVGRSKRGDVRAASDIPELVSRADVVVLALPLTEETEGLVDDSFLRRMRDGSLLVNVGRGSVVVTADLLRHVPRIEAALDVVDTEPLPDTHLLWSVEGVLITPHIGGDTDAFPTLMKRLIKDQVRRWRTGANLANVVRAG